MDIQHIKQIKFSVLLNECLLFNANSAICQLYHGENNLFSMHDGEVHFVLDQYT
jgi:hypothetical protein